MEILNSHNEIETELTALRASIEAARREMPEEPDCSLKIHSPLNACMFKYYCTTIKAKLEAVTVERDKAKAERGTLMAFPDENGETVWTPLGDDIRRIDRVRKQAEERATEAEAKLAAERDKALEDAAEVCATKWIPNAIYTGATLTEIEIEGSYNNAVTDCIGAIRALKSAGKDGE